MKSPQVMEKLYDVRMDCIFDCINNVSNGRCIFPVVFPHKHTREFDHNTGIWLSGILWCSQ